MVSHVVPVLLFLEIKHPQHEIVVMHCHIQIGVEYTALEGLCVAQIAHETVLVDQEFIGVVVKIYIT